MRLATWNMQGGQNVAAIAEVLATTHADILCVQECGDFTLHLCDAHAITDASGAVIGYRGHFTTDRLLMDCVFWENQACTHGSIAILSALPIIDHGILIAAPVPGYVPPNVRHLPWLTARNPISGAKFNVASLLGVPVHGGTTLADASIWNNTQLTQLNGMGGLWVCLGDYCCDPRRVGYIGPPCGTLLHGERPTRAETCLRDYAVSNIPGLGHFDRVARAGTSLHYPQIFAW